MRGDSTDTAPSGERLCPTVVSVTAPTPSAAASTNARRDTAWVSAASSTAARSAACSPVRPAAAPVVPRRASPRRISGALAPTCTATAPMASQPVQ